MAWWIIVAVAVLVALALFVTARASRVPVAVASSAADDARLLDEGMIVGDVVAVGAGDEDAVEIVPITAIDDVAGVTIIPSDVAPEEVRESPAAAQRSIIRWPKRFETQGDALADATRLSVLRDLGIVRAPWGVPLLTQAYEEESLPEHRYAALRSLAAYRHPDAQPTFEVALHAEDEEEVAIATAALSALRIRAALPS